MTDNLDWRNFIENLHHVRVLTAKHYACRAPLFGPLHSHEDLFHLTYVVSGRGKATIGGALIDAKPSDVFLLRPMQPHSSVDDDQTDYELIELRFWVKDPEVQSMIPDFGPVVHVRNVSAFMPALQRLVLTGLADMGIDNWLARVRLVEVLMLLAREAGHAGISDRPLTDLSLTVHKVADHIAAHYTDRLTLASLAELAGVSPSYLAAGFKRIMGVSPIELAIRTRIHHARELLRTSPFNVDRIASLCGFQSQQYFTRLFTRREGICPRDYRKRHISD